MLTTIISLWRRFLMIFHEKNLFSHSEIVGHFDKESSTYVMWRNLNGYIFSEQITTLTKRKYFLKQFSKKDIFLLGYLLGSEHERTN